MIRNTDSARISLLDLFESKELITMCAPMVRYSKLPFRMLVRKYGCDVAFTPMIVSHSFIESEKARHSDFTTAIGDRPLIVQFAAKHGAELAEAAEIVYRNSDGIDLNCGCPQRWALSDGYGACLLSKPEIVCDMIQQVRNRIPDMKYTISIKIRLHDDIRHSIEFCRQAEKAGVSWISVHGRTKSQRHEPVNLDAIKLIKENLSIPVVGNGDIFHLRDALSFQNSTGVNGVMSARGLLQNPSLFSGTEMTPPACVKDWINLSISYGATFTNIHHHLMFMLENVMSKSERKFFNSYTSLSSVLDHINEYSLYFSCFYMCVEVINIYTAALCITDSGHLKVSSLRHFYNAVSWVVVQGKFEALKFEIKKHFNNFIAFLYFIIFTDWVQAP